MSKTNRTSNRFWCRACYSEWRGGEAIACTCDITEMHWFCVNFKENLFYEFTEDNVLSTDSSIMTTIDRLTPDWMGVGRVG